MVILKWFVIVIGLLKLVSLFILCVIELHCKITKKRLVNLHKEYGIYTEDSIYILPRLSISFCGKYMDINFSFITWTYYSVYKLTFEDDEE